MSPSAPPLAPTPTSRTMLSSLVTAAEDGDSAEGTRAGAGAGEVEGVEVDGEVAEGEMTRSSVTRALNSSSASATPLRTCGQLERSPVPVLVTIALFDAPADVPAFAPCT